jgi:hypothetical protein
MPRKASRASDDGQIVVPVMSARMRQSAPALSSQFSFSPAVLPERRFSPAMSPRVMVISAGTKFRVW